MTDSTRAKPKRRWYHLTPGRLLIGLAAVEVFLLLSEQFRWFPKGWAVLISVTILCLAGVLMLLLSGVAPGPWVAGTRAGGPCYFGCGRWPWEERKR